MHATPRRHWRLLGVGVIGALAVLAAACTPPGPPPLEQIKRDEFGNRALAESELIGQGLAQPVLDFTVEKTPPSIFVNYVVPDAQAGAFEDFIDLPPGFSLSKVRILDSDPEARYWLSLNVYRVGGITTGLRAEWSTYVDDGTGEPRFMIVRARASEGSLDPLGPLALPEPFQHSLDDGVISTDMQRTEDEGAGPVLTPDDLFSSTITLPEPADRQHVRPSLEWIAANDFIYWLNGVNDRTFHDASAHSADLISVDLADVTVDDQTEWAPFVDPVPGHVLVYLDEIRFMIGPWWNVTEPDGRVDEDTRSSLFELKKTIYSGLTNLNAIGVLAGTVEPIVQSSVEDSVPPTTWHWRLDPAELPAFAAAAQLPAGLTLAPVRLQADDPAPEHWLTLHVRRVSGQENGLRADWSTYVDAGSGDVRSVVLDSDADHATLDPVDRFAEPGDVSHQVTGSSLDTTVGSGASAFTSSLDVPDPATAPTALPDRSWVTAGELRYWRNGVADRVFGESAVLGPRTALDPAAVSIGGGGVWAPFVAGGPDRVWLDRSGTDLVVNPWWTLAP